MVSLLLHFQRCHSTKHGRLSLIHALNFTQLLPRQQNATVIATAIYACLSATNITSTPSLHPQPPLPLADPLVLASAEAALAPKRAHLENAWKAATMIGEQVHLWKLLTVNNADFHSSYSNKERGSKH